MHVVYIAGPFRAETPWEVECNIRRAETLALEVWRAGAVALCPHTNTRFFDKALDDQVFLAGVQELLARSDCLLLVPGWRNSKGTLEEIRLAERWGKPVFTDITGFERWYARQEAK